MSSIQVNKQVQYYDHGNNQTRIGRVSRIVSDKAFVVFDDDMQRNETEVLVSSLQLAKD